MCPCLASTSAGRTGPTGPREPCGGERARRATLERDQRRGGVAAVAARRRSRRRAGEQEKLTCAQAPGGVGDVISVLGLAEEVAEGCCRR
jgi:hypothetical protein